MEELITEKGDPRLLIGEFSDEVMAAGGRGGRGGLRWAAGELTEELSGLLESRLSPIPFSQTAG